MRGATFGTNITDLLVQRLEVNGVCFDVHAVFFVWPVRSENRSHRLVLASFCYIITIPQPPNDT